MNEGTQRWPNEQIYGAHGQTDWQTGIQTCTDEIQGWATYRLAFKGKKGIHEWTARWTNRAQGEKDGMQRQIEKEREGVHGWTDRWEHWDRQGTRMDREGTGTWMERENWHSAGQDRVHEQPDRANE